ncbi:MAG: hypothetical protein E7055_01685 [Lentisphaerae bacterium]|nr:hypothetical protein [Lentisphaerota bacterium]
MGFWPDVKRGDKVQHHMVLENNLRHLVNSLDGFGSGMGRATASGVVRIQIWNATNETLPAGQPVEFDNTKPLCGDAVPAVKVTDTKKPWGVCVHTLDANAMGDCIISGPAEVALSGGSGDYAEPVVNGTGFTRSSTGTARVLFAGEKNIIVLGGAASSDYRGGFMCEITSSRYVIVYDKGDPSSTWAGYTTSGRTFWSYFSALPGYGTFYVWARLYQPAGAQSIFVYPADYPVINQYNMHFVLIAKVTSTENEYSVEQIFKDDKIDDSQHHYDRYTSPFQLYGSVSGSSGNYQVSLNVDGGTIYHSTGSVYGLSEFVYGQSIAAPADSVSVYLLYKRSSPGDSRFIIAKDCVLNNPKEFQLKLVGTIIKKQYGGYDLINDFVGNIADTVTRTATFNAYRTSTISESSTATGIVLSETVTGWAVSSGEIQYYTNSSKTLPAISGEFPSSGSVYYKYATLTYDPSTGQYTAAWTDQEPAANVYMWWAVAVRIYSDKTIYWVVTAPNFESGKIIVRDRWQ